MNCPGCNLRIGPGTVVCPNCGLALPGTSSGLLTSRPHLESTTPPEPPRVLASYSDAPPSALLSGNDLVERVLDFYSRGVPIVSVIGSFDSGKTFFVNRLRHDLGLGDSMSREGAEAEIGRTAADIELTEVSLQRPRPSPYLIVDMAGESLRKALDEHGRRSGVTGSDARPYLAAIGCASAYVLVFRAIDIAGGAAAEPDRAIAQTVQKAVDTIPDILSAIVISEERLRVSRQDPREFLATGFSEDELTKTFGRTALSRRPVVVAFSMADVLAKRNGGLFDDHDPFVFALSNTLGKKLVKALNQRFSHYRFDFLTAFENHPDGSRRPDYTSRSYGAVSLLLDLHGRRLALQTESRASLFRADPLRLTTQEAVRARCLHDKAFERLWNGA